MKKTVRLETDAEDEFDAAAAWYERQHPGLGQEFIDEVAQPLARVGESPQVFSLLPNLPRDLGIRRAGDGGTRSDAAATNDGSRDRTAGDAGAGGKAGGPVVLATGFDVAGSLASDGTNIFFGATNWHEDGGLVQETRLVQVPIAGGPMTTRYTYPAGATWGTGEIGGGITVDGTNLFFCLGGHAWSMPIAAGTAVDLMPAMSSPDYGCWLPCRGRDEPLCGKGQQQLRDLQHSQSRWNPEPLRRYDRRLTGGDRELLDGVGWDSRLLGAVRRHLQEHMQRALGAGRASETIVSPAPADAGALQYLGFTTSNLVLTGGYTYWMEFDTGFAPSYLWRVPVTGGTPVVVTSGNYIFQGLASDGTSLYWFESLNGVYSIKKTSVTPGSPVTTVVADAVAVAGNETSSPPRFTVDDTNVYWLYPPNLYKAPK